MIIGRNFKNVGKRKCAIVKVKLNLGSGKLFINDKDFLNYTQYNSRCENFFLSPLFLLNLEEKYDIFAYSRGGGITGQCEALKLAIARSIYSFVEDFDKQKLKENGFLTRNSLCKERRNMVLKKLEKHLNFQNDKFLNFI
uniref:Ribosomal protein S9 n=1 Tax=Phacus pleuronectes TaxID=102908 RepID=A0A3G3LLU2_9EUGL|nr:ribosomal protein S9 [Phacus pleuronectes]AYQ93676.1 ribosomal protein S9 [Phacus pleuronectes]